MAVPDSCSIPAALYEAGLKQVSGTSMAARAAPEFRTLSLTATISTTYGRPTFTSSLCPFAALPNM